jgi:hypothetical protein
LNSAPETTELDNIARFWGHAYTLHHDPGDHPAEPYSADRKDGKGTVRAATPALLLDAIKDDQTASGIAP